MHHKTWRVGVLFSETGVTAAVEQTQLAATLLAINQINAAGGVRGMPIEPISYDPGSNPERFRYFAKQLCSRDGVRVIFGCKLSSARKAVLPIVEATDALLFYPALYEGFEYSQHCIYTGAAPNQNSVQLVDYLASNYGKSVFLIGSNYVYPYESNRVVGDLFKQAGGRVTDEMYVPLNATSDDFVKVIDRIRSSRPEVIYSSLVGDSIAMFYDAYQDAGFDPQTMPIGSLVTGESEIAQMRSGAAVGHIISATYFSTLKSPCNDAFVSALDEYTGMAGLANSHAESAYFQVFLYAKALEASGTDELNPLLDRLYEVQIEAPQGAVKVDRDNNHTFLWPRVARIDEDSTPTIVVDAESWVRPDPFMVGQRNEDRSLVGLVNES